MPKKPLTAEEKVKKVLEKEFNTTFERNKPLRIGKSSSGEVKTHKFDLVSEDSKIVVEVKNSKLGNRTTQRSGYTTTRKWRLLGDCFYLSREKGAKKRILVLTNKELYKQFSTDMDGLLKDVEIRYVPVMKAVGKK